MMAAVSPDGGVVEYNPDITGTLEKLQNPPFGVMYKKSFRLISEALKARDWDACEREIEKLEDEVAVPNLSDHASPSCQGALPPNYATAARADYYGQGARN